MIERHATSFCQSFRFVLPFAAGQTPTGSNFPHTSQDLLAKSAQSALFAAGSALRFTKSKRLAVTLPQMTPGFSPYGPNPLEVTK